jgi:hypothetical protein
MYVTSGMPLAKECLRRERRAGILVAMAEDSSAPLHPPLDGSRSATHSRWVVPGYVLLLLAAYLPWARYDGYQIDGDAVSYMDIADLLRTHQWAGAVNAYWHPLYPACLALGRMLSHATRWNELGTYYGVNFAIFALSLGAVLCFTTGLVRLRHRLGRGIPLLGAPGLHLLGLTLVALAAQRELSLGKIRPDALLQTLLLAAVGMLLRSLASENLLWPMAMGACFGLAYLTKSFAFLLALVAIMLVAGFAWLVLRRGVVRVVLGAALALAAFAALAGPYIAVLSHQKGRFDFGDSGSLNYAWYIGGTEKMHLEPSMTDRFGAATVHLVHPERQLSTDPPIYSYRALRWGTYPDWFDTSFFNEHVQPHIRLADILKKDPRNVVLVLRYLLNHMEPLLLLAVLLLLGARLRSAHSHHWRHTTFWVPAFLLGCAVWGIYGIVNIEERYVTVGFILLVLPVFALLKGPALPGDEPALAAGGALHSNVSSGLEGTPLGLHVDAPHQAHLHENTLQLWNRGPLALAAWALVLFFAAVTVADAVRQVAEDRRQLSLLGRSNGWRDLEIYGAAEALGRMGVRPGDEIACIGAEACLVDPYWARLAGVRVLTEVYVPEGRLLPFLSALPDRSRAMDVVRHEGARVLVGFFDPGAMSSGVPAAAGWVRLGASHYYAFPLNLSGTAPKASLQ